MDKANFYIDSANGISIFIDVDGGIVQKCYNESKMFIDRMNELYIGKTISFLREDILEKFKGIYMNVRSIDVVNQIRKIDIIETQIRLNNHLIQSELRNEFHNESTKNKSDAMIIDLNNSKALIQKLTDSRDAMIVDLTEQKDYLNTIKETVESLHGFKIK